MHYPFSSELKLQISDKIVETLSLNGVTLENKKIHTLPLSPPFKHTAFCRWFILSILVAQTVAQHCMEGFKDGKVS